MSTTSSTLIPVIAAIFVPPLGVFLHEGLTSRFWISVVLTLIFFLPGLLYALYVILA